MLKHECIVLQAREAAAWRQYDTVCEEVRGLRVSEEGTRSAQRMQLQALQDELDEAWCQALQHQGMSVVTICFWQWSYISRHVPDAVSAVA